MDQVTAELCQKQIQHCHAWIEDFMRSEQGGSLQQFASLQDLLPLAGALTNTDDAAPAVVPPAQENEEDSAQARWVG